MTTFSRDITPNLNPNRVTVAIIALNEEQRIGACLDALSFADEILLIDAGSRDQTAAIAYARGAKVFVYADWQGFGEQRNRALQHVSSEFVLWIDADEIVSVALAAEVSAVARAPDTHAGTRSDAWAIRWSQMAFGRPLRFYRDNHWNIRLIRTRLLRGYEGVVHEAPVWSAGVAPVIGHLNSRLEHHTRPSVAASLSKVTQYAVLGAKKRRVAGRSGGVLRGLAAASRVFLLHYLLRGALLSGGRGFVFALLLAQEAFYKYAILAFDSEIAMETRA